jgi:hypothetical protein
MPANIVKSFADKTGKSEAEVEKLWNKAKEIAADNGHKEDYEYITGILKKMLSINEHDTFKQLIIFNEVSKYKINE